MQYIRFLKTPRLKAKAGRAQIAALITVTSDLGESFMLRDSPIIALVRLEDGTVIARREFSWTAGMRSLPIEILVERRPNGGRPVTLQVSANGLSADNLLLGPKSTILSVWSSPLTLNSEDVEDFVERRLDIGRGHHLSVWEETRDSIARHIW